MFAQSRMLISALGSLARESSPSFWWIPEMDFRMVMVSLESRIEATSSRSFMVSSSGGSCLAEVLCV